MAQGPILIVDDEPQNLAALRQVLAQEYKLVFAREGGQALEAAHECFPSLILLDIQMSDMTGYEVCRALKSTPPLDKIPVIFVTSMSDVGNEAAGFEAGAVDYITKPFSPPIVKARVRTHLSLVKSDRLEESHRNAIYMLSEAGHYNDSDTGVHIWRMAAYTAALAECSGWNFDNCKKIELAAPLHDTGKIGIPDLILRKPGSLDSDEWEIMKTHARIGYEILSRSEEPVFQMASEIALRHHEKWDGGGYPDGLSGEEIPESARIVAVADVFDALTMKRPYKEAWPIDRAMQTMKDGSGTHFEPRLIEMLEEILPEILTIKARWDNRETKGNAIKTTS